ncbi:MAG: DUF11 domain-containing protein [ANME-2 cluster archaeon]|nr:MAG: DUF11 domain-containing protein [ANME-2 cluster archaeon]
MLDRHTLGDSGCGIAVTNAAYMPDLAVEKTDDVADGECVGVGGNIQYTVSYENTGDIDLTGVTIVDDLPAEVDHVSGGTYNSVTHQVTWNIGDLAQGAIGSIQVDVQVNSVATPGSTIINYATIDSSETQPTTVQEKTDICTNQPPVADAGPPQTVEQESAAGALVTLDGSGSSDPDNDPLTYSWTWAAESAIGVSPEVILPPGTTTVTLVVDDGQLTDTDTVDITVEDTTPPEVACIESVNPPGENVPPAGSIPPPGSKDGQNEDGFYELIVTDNIDPEPEIRLTDTEKSFWYGLTEYTFTSGTTIKYTEVSGTSAVPRIEEMGSENADEVDWHIWGLGDLIVSAEDESGNVGSVTCNVHPYPK